MCTLDLTQYFLLPWKIPEEIADDQFSSITEESIYYNKHMCIQPFSELTRNVMFNGSMYYVLYLYILRFTLWDKVVWHVRQEFCGSQQNQVNAEVYLDKDFMSAMLGWGLLGNSETLARLWIREGCGCWIGLRLSHVPSHMHFDLT